MYNPTTMQIHQTLNKLRDKILRLMLGQSFPFFQDIIQRIITAQFQQYIYILVIFKHMIESYHPPMFQSFMNFYLSD